MDLPRELLSDIAKDFDGEFFQDETTRILYATDGSVYREIPLAVACPKNEKDIKTLVSFAHQHGIS